MLKRFFNRVENSAETDWSVFYQKMAAAHDERLRTKYSSSTSSIIPIIDIEYRDEERSARHQVGMHATMGFILLKQPVKDFLLLTKAEIWTAIDYEALARKSFTREKDIQREMERSLHTAAQLHFPDEENEYKPIIFLPYRTVSQTRRNVAPGQYHYGGLAHEAGHLLDWSLGWFSQTKVFQDAYEEDIDRLLLNTDEAVTDIAQHFLEKSGYDKNYVVDTPDKCRAIRHKIIKAMEYFLPRPFSANSTEFASKEAFAEIFSALQFTQGTRQHNDGTAMLKVLFPSTFEVMHKVCDTFELTMNDVRSSHKPMVHTGSEFSKNIA